MVLRVEWGLRSVNFNYYHTGRQLKKVVKAYILSLSIKIQTPSPVFQAKATLVQDKVRKTNN